MPPKNQKRNGFWYFSRDFQKREESKGVQFPGGLKEIMANPRCSKEWKELTEEKKQDYQSRAKKYNGSGSSVKLTSLGDPISVMEEKLQKIKEFEENMRIEIKEKLSIAHTHNTIPDLSFYLIHTNYFYTKTSDDSVIDYIPAEFAVIEFSLKEGQIRYFHQIIRTKFELGYTREALEISDASHKLTENMKQGEDDFTVMYDKLVKFLRNDDKKSGKLPAIYTTKEMANIVPCLLERLTQAAGVPEDTLTLYSLEYLFGTMMTYVSSKFAGITNPHLIASSELEKGAFSYSPDLECDFHKTIADSSIHCSLSIVRQWVFAVCDFCCGEFKITMKPGIHLPDTKDKNQTTAPLSRSSSMASITSSMHSLSCKSATGVSKSYKPAYNLTPEEDRRRREAKTPLTIIDHGEQMMKKTHRLPNSLSKTMSGMSLNSPSLDEANFPSIGGGGRGRIIPKDKKLLSPIGRGRGGSGI
ncbi:hypothetical protein HCN44_004122 [Aphidius gifuensis]|uniref:Maelstrom domain-containing protein n=1 Tax=Aphidius gifuensis TaxID=684658 RepID=A0A834XWB7_APHGI|nr:hypothetical protein HCN44_004122 [Aphidius gifuensis]